MDPLHAYVSAETLEQQHLAQAMLSRPALCAGRGASWDVSKPGRFTTSTAAAAWRAEIIERVATCAGCPLREPCSKVRMTYPCISGGLWWGGSLPAHLHPAKHLAHTTNQLLAQPIDENTLWVALGLLVSAIPSRS